MNILIAPGPYKECLSAEDVASCIEEGIKSIRFKDELVTLPLCDGGTGFVKRMVEAYSGKIIPSRVTGPLGYQIETSYGVLNDKVAVVESASICGLSLVPTQFRNPLITTTYGIGEIISQISEKGYTQLLIGMGDSSTTDGGVGALQALGVKFLDESGKEIGLGGAELLKVKKIDISSFHRPKLEIIIACNLTSVICGNEGTALVYGPQKGASRRDAYILHNALNHYSNLIWETFQEDISFLPGGGGSGGLAGGLYAFVGAKLDYSMNVVSTMLNLDEIIKNTDLIITGEGKIDDRTAGGKIACGISLIGKKYNIPSIAIVGQIEGNVDDVYYNGIDYIQPIIQKPETIEESILNAKPHLIDASKRIARIIPFFEHRKVIPKHPLCEESRGITTLLFDLGNTLIHIPEEYDMDINLAKELKLEEEDAKSIIYTLCDTNVNISIDNFIRQLSIKVGKPPRIITEICQQEIEGARISPDAISVLKYFKEKKYELILVSNTPPTTKEIITRFELDKYFNTIILSCDVGYLKPDPRIFQLAIKQTNKNLNEVCVIGDKIRTDILGGKILGTKTVLLEKKSQRMIQNDKRIPVDAIITCLEDLLTLDFLK